MLNFLPQKNRNEIIFEYLLRVNIYVLSFILIATSILIILFFPSYFYVKLKNKNINSQLDFAKQKNINKGEDPIVFIKDLNRLSLALSVDHTYSVLCSVIIDKLVLLKNNNIKIYSINIEHLSDGTRKILLNGVAKTRDSLTMFDKEIKTDGFFKSASFPVSNFIKSSNSDFSAVLTI